MKKSATVYLCQSEEIFKTYNRPENTGKKKKKDTNLMCDKGKESYIPYHLKSRPNLSYKTSNLDFPP